MHAEKGTPLAPTRGALIDSDIHGQKRLMRAQILTARDNLPPEIRRLKSHAVCRMLEPLLVDAVRNGGDRIPLIAAYASMKSELDLLPLIESERAAAWEWCFPCMIAVDEMAGTGIDAPSPTGSHQRTTVVAGTKAPDPCDSATCRMKSRMEFFRVPRAAALARTAPFLARPTRSFDRVSLEDRGFTWVDPSEINAVLVPLVGFDARFNRLGYGGGNYDRFLASIRESTFVTGVAFEEQRVSSIPCEAHDRPLPLVVSA